MENVGLGQMDSEAKFSNSGFITFISLILCREIQGSSYQGANSKDNGLCSVMGLAVAGDPLSQSKKLFPGGKRGYSFGDGQTQSQTPALLLINLGFIFFICNKTITVFTLQDGSEI